MPSAVATVISGLDANTPRMFFVVLMLIAIRKGTAIADYEVFPTGKRGWAIELFALIGGVFWLVACCLVVLWLIWQTPGARDFIGEIEAGMEMPAGFANGWLPVIVAVVVSVVARFLGARAGFRFGCRHPRTRR